MNRIARASLGMLFVASVGCAPVGDAPEGLGTDTQEVVNGAIAFDDAVRAYGLVTVSWNGLGCTGVVYKNSWVLTASHCFNFTEPTAGVTVTFAGQSFTGDRVRRVSTADLALVHLTAPVTMNGSTTGYTVPFYQGTIPALQGRGLYCFGAGTHAFRQGGGAIVDWRMRWAVLTVASYWVEGRLYNFAPNSLGQILGGGDSGGPCFDYANGVMSLTGISRNAGRVCANLQPGQACDDNTVTSIAWSDQTFARSYAGTMTLLTGGPLNPVVPRFP
jgi:hypothetical protein